MAFLLYIVSFTTNHFHFSAHIWKITYKTLLEYGTTMRLFWQHMQLTILFSSLLVAGKKTYGISEQQNLSFYLKKEVEYGSF